MRRNCDVLTINAMMIMKMKELFMEGEGGLLVLTLTGEADSLNPIGEIGFLIISETKKKDTQILMSLVSLLLMGILMLSQHCFRLRKLIICLIYSIFPWRIMSYLWFINLKKGQRPGGISCKTSVCAKQTTLTGEADSLNLIGEIGFLIISETKEEDTQILMSLVSLLLMGILMLSQHCFRLRKLIICLT